jgi:putative oxidoreductase
MKSLGLLVIRLVIGSIFFLHGLPKLYGGEGTSEKLSEQQKKVLGAGFVQSLEQGGVANTAKMLEGMDVPNPTMMAWGLGLTEALGGLALVFGAKTRPAAIALATSQMVAVGKVHGEQGLINKGGYEYNLALIGVTVGLAIAGPGKLSKD